MPSRGNRASFVPSCISPILIQPGADILRSSGAQHFRGIANGSYHGGENQLLFGNWDVPALDANQQALADQMKEEWTAFAQTGNPTAAAGPIWPAFRPRDESVMSLQPAGDSQIMTQSEMSAVHNCSFWNSLATRGA